MPSAFIDFIKNITKKKEIEKVLPEKQIADYNELFKFCRNIKVTQQDREAILKLIDKDVSIVDKEDPITGMTPIMVASNAGNVYALETLLFKQVSHAPQIHGEKYQRYPIKPYKTNLEGLNALELAADYRTKTFLKNYYERHDRFKDTTIQKGWHETGFESFNYIFNDHRKGLYPFFGGDGGYFGGGVYFALFQQESSRKALHHGYGFQCKIKMGEVCNIRNKLDLDQFIKTYCRNQNSYELPNDVMRWRLQYFGDKPYDSVWGHKGETLPFGSPPPIPDNRILQTGDEIVAYYPDQISIVGTYITNREDIEKSWTPLLEGFQFIPTTLFDDILHKASAESIGYLDYNKDGTLLRRLERNVNDQTDEIKIYDTRDKYVEKETIKVLTPHEQIRNYVTHFAFHPTNPDICAVVLNKKSIRLYTPGNPEKFIVINPNLMNITSIHFHPIKEFLYAISYDKSILYCWDLKGELLQQHNLEQPLISQFIFNKEGTYLASKNLGQIKIWKIEQSELTLIAEFNKGFMGEYMNDMEFYGENNLIINIGSYILIWKDFINNTNVTWGTTPVDSNKIAKFTGGMQHDKKITSISVHEQSATLLSSSLDQTIKYWDINKLKCTKTIELGIPVNQVIFNPNPSYENENAFSLENRLCYIGPSTLTSGGKRKSLKRVKRPTTIPMK